MDRCLFYTAGNTPSLRYCVHYLSEWGIPFSPIPTEDITHLLLPVPSLDDDKHIKGDGLWPEVLGNLPKGICIFGGKLPPVEGYTVHDLIEDTDFAAQNAYITAHCALRLVMERLPATLRGQKILVIGWGRIGKCLADLLRRMDAQVTVIARRSSEQALACALGYETTTLDKTDGYRVIFNTVPALVLPDAPADALKIDLASKPGIGGTDVLWARGLPGKFAPESAGKLIAQTILRLLKEEEK